MVLPRTLLFATLLLPVAAGVAASPRAADPASRTTTVATARPSAQVNWGQPIFTDNFNGTRLNPADWSIYNDPDAKSPKPRRTISSVKVRNGFLELIGHDQKPYGDVSGGVSFNANQTYGRWVVRFRADAGAGYAPVVLLWPEGKWPNDGEIDLAEITSPQRIGASENLHLGQRQKGSQIKGVNFTSWHTLAVDWLPSHITFWLDNKVEWTVNRAAGQHNYIPDTPFHLALQNDQGCDTGCKPNRHTPRQVIMQVDWVKIYAAPGSQPAGTLADPASRGVRGVAYRPDGKRLATADGNGHAYVWTAPGYQSPSTLADPSSRGANAVAFSPDGSTLAIGDANGHVYLSRPPGLHALNGSATAAITSVAFTTQGHYLAAGDANGHTYIWAVSSSQTPAALTDPASKGVRAVAYSPNGKLLATADGNGHTYIWALPGYQLLTTLTDPASKGVNAVAFTTRSHYLAAADGNGHTYLWWLSRRSILATLNDPGRQPALAAAYSPDGKLLATADDQGHVLIWALPDYKPETTLTDPASRGATSLTFGPDSTTLAVGDRNGRTYRFTLTPH